MKTPLIKSVIIIFTLGLSINLLAKPLADSKTIDNTIVLWFSHSCQFDSLEIVRDKLKEKYPEVEYFQSVRHDPRCFNEIIITLSDSQEVWTEKLEVYRILDTFSDKYEYVDQKHLDMLVLAKIISINDLKKLIILTHKID